MMKQFERSIGWCRERPMLMYWLFVAVFLLAEQLHKPTAVVIACIPGWLAMIWCGWIARWPRQLTSTALQQTYEVKARLLREVKWMILTLGIFLPTSIYILMKP